MKSWTFEAKRADRVFQMQPTGFFLLRKMARQSPPISWELAHSPLPPGKIPPVYFPQIKFLPTSSFPPKVNAPTK